MRSNIINPARLPVELRDDVCEQCHLSGEARILNPGKQFSDFVAGKRLEDVLVTYVAEAAGDRPLKVISHSEQLRLSKCWQKSEQQLWCGTCHNPHLKLADQVENYRAKCLSCHFQTLPKEHQAADANCVGCHMPVRGTIDGAHTAFTDHRIRRRPVEAERNVPDVTQLTAWQRPPEEYAARDLGLAYLSVGERTKSLPMLQQAFETLVRAQKHLPKDPEVTAGLALILYLKGLNRQAAVAFELAAQLRPEVRFYRDAAAAWQANGNLGNAIRDLNVAIEADQSDENSYRMLAELFRVTGDTAAEQRVVDKYLMFRPQSIEFRQRRKSHTPATP